MTSHENIESTSLTAQLNELQLIRCSLIPGELFAFLLPDDESSIWSSLIENIDQQQDEILSPSMEARFQVKLEGSNIWFEVELPHRYSGISESSKEGALTPVISVKGEDLTREEQERWQRIIQQKWRELQDDHYPLYQLLSLHLLPMLHEHLENASISVVMPPSVSSTSSPGIHGHPLYHVLFSSHHLISPNKRRSLQKWSSDLSLSGFAKVGHPGIIYAVGARENVDEFTANVKAMQWLALRVRFIEPLVVSQVQDPCSVRWLEFQKVGEVVEEMRKLGRENLITEMGIGSISAPK